MPVICKLMSLSLADVEELSTDSDDEEYIPEGTTSSESFPGILIRAHYCLGPGARLGPDHCRIDSKPFLFHLPQMWWANDVCVHLL